jgi:hypothetical protein
MQPASHIDDDALSAFVDQELGPEETARTGAHLETCTDCQERLDGLRSVAVLLRRLPEVEPPRDFALGPRLVAEPPNVVRLKRWYTAARVAATALAAVCVFLLAGTLYFDAKSAPPTRVEAPRPVSLAAPAAAPAALPPPAASAPRAASPESSQAAPAAAQAPASAAAGDAAPHPNVISTPQADDQVAAATSVSPLPTPPPTPVPTAVPAPVAAVVATAESSPGAPFGLGALAAGILAIIALLIALVARQRLQRASTT